MLLQISSIYFITRSTDSHIFHHTLVLNSACSWEACNCQPHQYIPQTMKEVCGDIYSSLDMALETVISLAPALSLALCLCVMTLICCAGRKRNKAIHLYFSWCLIQMMVCAQCVCKKLSFYENLTSFGKF